MNFSTESMSLSCVEEFWYNSELVWCVWLCWKTSIAFMDVTKGRLSAGVGHAYRVRIFSFSNV